MYALYPSKSGLMNKHIVKHIVKPSKSGLMNKHIVKLTVECQIKPHAATLKSGKWLKLNVAAPPVSQAFGHVESSRLVPRGAHSSPITIQQKHDQRTARVMVDLKANILRRK